MQILHWDDDAAWSGPLLCVTHSQRRVDLARCGRDFLRQRYGRADRLPPATAFEELRPAIDASPFKGDVTVWQLTDLRRPRMLAHLRPPGYKPQHAIWHRGRLWVLGAETIEVFTPLPPTYEKEKGSDPFSIPLEAEKKKGSDPFSIPRGAGGTRANGRLRQIATINDPWLSGGHTIIPDGDGRLIVTCSASDALLWIDEATLRVVDAWRLPESHYGRNYDLTRQMSVVDHFIDNDRQLTHVNAAWPWRGGVLLSTLIQGAVGYVPTAGGDRGNGGYVELTRGHVGCHGVRADDRGRIYFCDSCAGTLNRLGPDGRVRVLIDVQSVWLHDAQHVAGEVYALAVADRNVVELIDLATGDVIGTVSGEGYGESTQFVWYGC